MRRALILPALLALPIGLLVAPVISAPTPTPHAVAPRVYHHSLNVPPQPVTSGGLVTTGELATKPFRAVGLSWRHDPAITNLKAEIRVRTDGRWTSWQDVEASDIGADRSTDSGRVAPRDATEPLWVDHADGVQVRLIAYSGDEPRDLRIELIDPGASAADAHPGPPHPLQTAVAAAAQPQIYTRAQWGADESLRLSACPDGPQYTGPAKVGFVHHTVTGNSYTPADVPAIIRSIYAYHVQGEGWCDIGYNFLVDQFGRIWEGRYGGVDKNVLGAHTGGFNTNSFGVAMIGTFTTAVPPTAMVNAVAALMAWKFTINYDNPLGTATLVAASFSGSRYAAGTPVTLNVVSGHRDVDLTDCPGNGGYSVLPTIRRLAAQDMGNSGLVQPSATVTQRTVSGNGRVRITAGMMSPGSWTLAVQNSAGATVRTVSGSGSAVDVTWDMTDDSGVPVPPGPYTVTLSSVQNGNAAYPWSTTVVVGAPFGSLDGATAPAVNTVEVRGWALSGVSDDPVTVRVTVSGATVGTTTATAPRPDVAAVFPGYSINHGYDATFSASPGYHTVCTFGVTTVGGPDTLLGCRGVTVPGPSMTGNPQGNFETIRGGPGVVEVTGWALDPDTVNPITVHVYVDRAFAAAVTADGNRPDVAAVFPQYGPAHGFDGFVTGLYGGTHTVCVFAINVGPGTVNPVLGCKQVSLPGGNPFGNFEAAQGLPGAARVTGWTIDPDTANPILVHVYVDGRFAGLGRADGNRPDVAAAFPGYGAAHGFDVTVPVSYGGRHQVCVYSINVGVGSVNPLLGCRTVTLPTGVPFGSLDTAVGGSGTIHVTGWAIDPDVVTPIVVHIYVDGRATAALTANGYRPDVAAAFPGYGSAHGFAGDVGASPGTHLVCAYGINAGPGNANPLFRCLRVTVR